MRGKVVRLPAADSKEREILVHHEAVDTFRNSAGAVDPMPEMTMPFPLAPHVAAEGLEIGDEVEFRYEVRWKSQPHEQVTALKKVPPGTAKIKS
jgi:Cu/Ag efflux protein CusF